LRIGVAGAGHLGKIHLNCLKKTDFILVGFFDPDPLIRENVAKDLGVTAFESLEDLLSKVDCLDVVSPTSTHFEVAQQSLLAGKHIFIEKPLTETIEQAKILMDLTQKAGVVVQVGHVERYNPAIRSLKEIDIKPRFIEGHRLAMFNPRGTDVSVVLDLMIHDIDIVLSLVKDDVMDVKANGVCIVSKTPDICNARIEFKNGTVANLTASRISLKNMRKFRIFQDDAYISLDFLDKKAQIVTIKDADKAVSRGIRLETVDGMKDVFVSEPDIMSNNAIEEELKDFYSAVTTLKPATVGIEDGYKALHLAYQIEDKISGKA